MSGNCTCTKCATVRGLLRVARELGATPETALRAVQRELQQSMNTQGATAHEVVRAMAQTVTIAARVYETDLTADLKFVSVETVTKSATKPVDVRAN